MIILSIRHCVFNNISYVFLINYNTQTLKYYSKTDWVNKARLGMEMWHSWERKPRVIAYYEPALDLTYHKTDVTSAENTGSEKSNHLPRVGQGVQRSWNLNYSCLTLKFLTDLRCVSGHMKTISVDLSFPCAQGMGIWRG